MCIYNHDSEWLPRDSSKKIEGELSSIFRVGLLFFRDNLEGFTREKPGLWATKKKHTTCPSQPTEGLQDLLLTVDALTIPPEPAIQTKYVVHT